MQQTPTARAVRSAQRRHLTIGWRITDAALEDLGRARGAGIDD